MTNHFCVVVLPRLTCFSLLVFEEEMNFQWSLQPILRWMSCIGIFLESPASDGSPFRFWIIAYGLTLFFVNLFRNGMFIGRYFPKIDDPSPHMSRPVLWSSAISMLNYFIVTTGSQLSLIAGSISRWPRLVRILRQMESEPFFEAKHYQRFRRICITGFAFLIAIMVAVTVAMTIMVVPVDIPVLDKVNELLQPTLVVYVFSGGVMFSCLGWMTSDMFTILAQKVMEQTSQSKSLGHCDWSQRLDSWRHQHYTILQLVDEINNCYSCLLLVVIASTFVVMISTSFIIMRHGLRLESLLPLFLLMTQFGHFAVVIYVPHRIRQSAICFTKTLRCLEFGDQILQDKLNFLTVYALDSLPKMTALGLFDVNLRLVPSIVGTTMTYLIILCQFQYSEN